jgi:hypothetical protein
MTMRSTQTPRISTFFVLALLAACTPPAAEDDGETGEDAETGETGDPMIDEEACVDPGTELLPEAKPALLPSSQNPVMYTCTSGWGTDAPHLDPEWTVQVGQATNEFGFMEPAIATHPEDGVVVAGFGEVSQFGSTGERVWTASVPDYAQYFIAVEDSGDILVATDDWNTQTARLTRYSADGTDLGDVVIPWNGTNPSIWGLGTFGSDIVIGGYDEDMQGNYESTLIRLDLDGNVVLRKSTNMVGGELLAVTDGGVAMFGTFPGFLVSLDNGEVLGMLTPSAGSVVNVIGSGDDFFMAGSFAGTTGDFGVGRYTSLGGETWLQGYDRATLGDSARAIAVGSDGNLAVAGTTSMLNFTGSYWYNTQPLVFGVDADGNALWSDRIAAHGEASGVAVALNGDVYVTGFADAGEIDDNDPPLMMWLRRYVP